MTAASERLARTRLAIIDEACDQRRGRAGDSGAAWGTASRWQRVRTAARTWWQQHPAHQAADIAGPLLAAWSRRHPGKLLALSLAAGAALVLARPWRLVSITGLLLAALRSPQLSAMLMSALSTPEPAAFGAGSGVPPPEERSTP
ncbi:hypothetical protein ACT80S_08775 [Ramlibacter sp. MAHUQ-53]|uniref:hypothetical protein n=1 Tax=unclassified Ramlibacter TaxID=2617605 RepID=UPI00362C433E